MGQMKLPPGVIKSESKMAASGRFVDCDHVRWVRGKAQKIGGWDKITDTAMSGTPRGMHGWSDGTAKQLIAVGTEQKLYVVPFVDYVPVNITPYRSVTATTDPFTTTNGLPTVNVYLPDHNAAVGTGVTFSGASAVNGITLDGDYEIASVVDDANFTVTAGNNASGTGSGGGAVTISIEIEEGYASPTYLYGYGIGPYGMGTYGTPRTVSSYLRGNRQWTLDNFGKILLANYNDGALYSWDPTADPRPRAAIVTDTPYYPSVMTGFIVSTEGIVIAYGTNSNGTQDLLEVWTSRQRDYLDWDYTGVANDQGAPPTVSRLAIGKKIVGAANLGSFITCLWTDAALYLKQYTGSSLVFSTPLKGEDCGLIGPMAKAVHKGVAYWVSDGAFFQYDGAISRIPNSEDIAEWIFNQLRALYNVKCFASIIPRYSEVWFFFVVGNNVEPTIYAVYNIEGQFWFHGTMARTSIARLAGQHEPIMASSDGYLYEHETGVNADGAEIAWSLESAPFALQNYKWVECFEIQMDMQEHVGSINIIIDCYDGTNKNTVPIQTETVAATPDDASVYPRIAGKQVAVTFEGSGVNCNFRMGVPDFVIGEQRVGR